MKRFKKRFELEIYSSNNSLILIYLLCVFTELDAINEAIRIKALYEFEKTVLSIYDCSGTLLKTKLI